MNKAKNDGTTPLYIASYKGHCDVVEALVRAGADLTLAWRGQTPLHSATTNGHTDVVRVLQAAAAAGAGRLQLFVPRQQLVPSQPHVPVAQQAANAVDDESASIVLRRAESQCVAAATESIMAFTFGNRPTFTAAQSAQVPSFGFAVPAAAASAAAPPAFALGAPAMGGSLTAPISAGAAWPPAATLTPASGGWPQAAQQPAFGQQTTVNFMHAGAASASAQAPFTLGGATAFGAAATGATAASTSGGGISSDCTRAIWHWQ